jgi:hypothetical protein
MVEAVWLSRYPGKAESPSCQLITSQCAAHIVLPQGTPSPDAIRPRPGYPNSLAGGEHSAAPACRENKIGLATCLGVAGSAPRTFFAIAVPPFKAPAPGVLPTRAGAVSLPRR